MSEDRIELFANMMINRNIIESLQMCIYRFDIGNDAITNAYLCQDHIDEKNDQKFPRVVVFSTMIWNSATGYGEKGWRFAVICYTRKGTSDYYKRLQHTCGPAVKHCIEVVKTFPTWRCNMFHLKKYLDSLTPNSVLQSNIREDFPILLLSHI